VRIALLAHCHHPIAEPYLGGLEMHTALVADELVRRGHEVTLFAKAGSRSLARVRPVVHRRFVFSGPNVSSGQSEATLDRAMSAAARAIAAANFDVILNNSLSPVPYRELDGLPMLTILHTPASLDRVNHVLAQPGWRPGLQHAYAAVSGYTRSDWARILPEVSCIPNGIDQTRWSPTPGRRPDPRLAVWAARITPEKGLKLAIEATRAAGLELEFAGPISDQDYFDQVITPLLGDDVRYAGHLRHRDLVDFLQRGTVFVSSPLWPEPFGLALVEAMACGTPAAALPRGAAAEVVSAAGGTLATEPTAAALAVAITRAARLDRNGVRASVSRFDHGAMVSAYEDVLFRLSADRRATTRTLAVPVPPATHP
jgi:glycosyltransferase involved in cell wall biosynthesis